MAEATMTTKKYISKLIWGIYLLLKLIFKKPKPFNIFSMDHISEHMTVKTNQS